MWSALQKEFVKALTGLSDSREPRSVFSDWLEIAAIELHQLPYHSQDFPKDNAFATREARYLEAVKPYTRDQLSIMSELFGLTLRAFRQEFGDFLGEIASEQEFLNARSGQFFTPYEVCRAMAKMTLHDARSLVDEKGLITISDPASGGGALLIACAQELWNQGIDPRSYAQFDAIDISRDAFNMTYIQLSFLDLQALVHHGDALTEKMRESRPTAQLRYFDRWLNERQVSSQLEHLIKLMSDPEAFSQQEEATRTSAGGAPEPEERDTDSAPSQANIAPESESTGQISLFDSEPFSSPVPPKSKKPNRQADIILPSVRQLDLFSQNRQLD